MHAFGRIAVIGGGALVAAGAIAWAVHASREHDAPEPATCEIGPGPPDDPMWTHTTPLPCPDFRAPGARTGVLELRG